MVKHVDRALLDEQTDAHVYLGPEVGRLLQAPGRFYASQTSMVRPCCRIQLAFYVFYVEFCGREH